MHTEDDSDNLDITTEITFTRSKAQANAAALALDSSYHSTLTKTTVVVLPTPKQPVDVPETQPEPKRAPETVTQAKTAYAGISLDATLRLADQPELDLARAFHSTTFLFLYLFTTSPQPFRRLMVIWWWWGRRVSRCPSTRLFSSCVSSHLIRWAQNPTLPQEFGTISRKRARRGF